MILSEIIVIEVKVKQPLINLEKLDITLLKKRFSKLNMKLMHIYLMEEMKNNYLKHLLTGLI